MHQRSECPNDALVASASTDMIGCLPSFFKISQQQIFKTFVKAILVVIITQSWQFQWAPFPAKRNQMYYRPLPRPRNQKKNETGKENRITDRCQEIYCGIRTGSSKTAFGIRRLLTRQRRTRTSLIENAKGQILNRRQSNPQTMDGIRHGAVQLQTHQKL